MERVDENLDLDSMFEMEETEKAMVYQTYTETMHLCYNFGFEVSKTTCRLKKGKTKKEKSESLTGIISMTSQTPGGRSIH